MAGRRDKKKDKKKNQRNEAHFSNPATRFYEPGNDYGIHAYFPPPEYTDRTQETWLRENPPWGYRPPSITDPTHRRRQAEAERRVRARLGFNRAEQLSVQRSVGVASLLNANLQRVPGLEPLPGPLPLRASVRACRPWAYTSPDASLHQHRVSEVFDAAAEAAHEYRAVTALRAKAAARAAARETASSADRTADTMPTNEFQGKSARAIAGKLMMESVRNLCLDRSASALGLNQERESAVVTSRARPIAQLEAAVEEELDTTTLVEERQIVSTLDGLKRDLRGIQVKNHELLEGTSKQTAIEIEQLNARVVEAETKLKTEVTRIKKKMMMTITELEMSLDVANKNNLELQKTIKKQSLQLTELQAHYDETQRQLAVTLDQYGIAQRRLQSMTSELEEVRANYESALRSKRSAEMLYEEAQSRINELTTINVNLSAARSKLEQELGGLASDYEEVTKELRVSDERYQRVQVELKHTVEQLHEEQERVIKIETIKKSLEIEVKNLSVRLEEVEANAIVGGKRIISKLEARMRDMELELDEEKRRHAETIKILRKKERHVKEVMIQNEEDQKNISLLQEMLDKTSQKLNIYKRQLTEQEGMSQQSVTRTRRFQRELEAAEDRAENAESNLSLIRAKHRTFVTTSTVPGSQVYMVQETRSSSETY